MNATTPPHSDLRSRSLDLLRYPLAIVVLIAHTTNTAHIHSYAPDAGRFVYSFMSNQSVPIYFFIAGYVFFLNAVPFTRQVYARKLRNRARSLLVPYLAWNILAYLLYTIWRGDFEGWREFLYGLGPALIGQPGVADNVFPADPPLWFVRNLMIMALLTPALSLLFRRLGVWSIVAFGTLYFSTLYFREWKWVWPSLSLFFFSWGAWMSYNGQEMMKTFHRWRIPAYIVYPAAALAAFLLSGKHMPQAVFWCKQTAILAGPFFAYNVAAACVRRGRLQWLSRMAPAAFFVFCSHFVILAQCHRLWTAVVHPDSATGAIVHLILFTVSLALVTTGAFFVMRRYAPRVLAPFVGGRL